MNASKATPFPTLVSWLTQYTRFPASRLAPDAEMLLLFAAAQGDEGGTSTSTHFERRVGAETSSQRAHALRRSTVHFKCDNSAKV